MNPSLRVKKAAQYLTDHGVQRSKSWLEKARAIGSDDARDPGPAWSRDGAGICWYTIHDLDAYIVATLSARRPRAAAPQPAHFRRSG